MDRTECFSYDSKFFRHMTFNTILLKTETCFINDPRYFSSVLFSIQIRSSIYIITTNFKNNPIFNNWLQCSIAQ